MATLGTDLQQAREHAGLSLDDLSARTKIRKALLSAIERDDYRSVPGGLLARGYLRAYAREVGLPAEPVASRYQTEFGAEVAPLAEVFKHHADVETLSRPRSHAPLAMAALLAIAGTWVYLTQRQAPAVVPQAIGTSGQTGQTDRLTDRAAVSVQAANAAAPTASSPSSAPLTVEISTTRVVWVEASADRTRVLYTLVAPDQRRTIAARQEIQLRIGDAGAFRYRINGVEGREVGRSGEVREVRITPQNLQTFQRQ